MTIPLTEQLACVEREIKMRERVYPRWVADKRMTKAKADHELAAMRAVRETIAGLSTVSVTLNSNGSSSAVFCPQRRASR